MNERIRVDMRFPKELVAWVKQQAKKKHKSITQVFIDAILMSQQEDKRHDRSSVTQ